jgi:NitT/TauT family transport system substrate-binding protein
MKKFAATFLAAVAIAAIGGATSPARADDVIRAADGPFITGGAFYIARDKGYFKKLGINIETKQFPDGAFAVPSMVSGELDISFMTPSASLFNSVAKGAPLVIILDRGNNKPGSAYTVLSVRKELADGGIKTLKDVGKLKGMRIGANATGSINHYQAANALLKAGLDPAKDVQWVANIPQPDMMKMLGTNGVDAADLAYQFGFFAQNNGWGPIVVTGDEVSPNASIAMIAVHKDFLAKKRDVVVHFAMAYLQAAKEFNAAAAAPDKYADIVEILAKNTALNKPELVKAIAPHWGYIAENGLPSVDSIMAMQDFWSGKYYQYVEKKVTREQLFDLSIANEAKARLDKEKPFGN